MGRLLARRHWKHRADFRNAALAKPIPRTLDILKLLKYLISFVGTLLLAASAAHSAVKAVHEFKSGHWQGYAYVDNETGAFSHCALIGSYQNGTNLLFLMIGDDLYLGMQNASWQLEEGQTFRAKVLIDYQIYKEISFETITGNIVRGYIGPYRSSVDPFRHGKLMTVKAAKSDFFFRLDGTYNALPKLRDCMKLAAIFVPKDSNPFFDNGASNRNPFFENDNGRKSTNSEWILKLLNIAGFENLSGSPPDDPDVLFEWEGDDLWGFVTAAPLQGRDERTVIRDVMSEFDSLCEGRQASAFENPMEIKKWIAYEALSACENTEISFSIHVMGLLDTERQALVIFVNIMTDNEKNLGKLRKFSDSIYFLLSENAND